MNRSDNTQALLNKAKKDFVVLQKAYEESLAQQVISAELKVDVKNIFENLRSCLDYIAHDIHSACIGGQKPKRLYFPIRQSKVEFDQAIAKDFSGLELSHKGVYDLIENIQSYNDSWLGKFNKLNNNNKHQDLEEQTRTESKRVTVSSPKRGGSVSWGEGVSFGSGVSVMGAAIDPSTQLPEADSNVMTEITIWVDFKFQDNGESIIPFIEQSINKVEKLFLELGAHI
nr:hypothetical protein [uncultured Vibrio sp.]